MKIAGLDIGSSGLLLLPHLAGAATPYKDSGAKGGAWSYDGNYCGRVVPGMYGGNCI